MKRVYLYKMLKTVTKYLHHTVPSSILCSYILLQSLNKEECKKVDFFTQDKVDLHLLCGSAIFAI